MHKKRKAEPKELTEAEIIVKMDGLLVEAHDLAEKISSERPNLLRLSHEICAATTYRGRTTAAEFKAGGELCLALKAEYQPIFDNVVRMDRKRKANFAHARDLKESLGRIKLRPLKIEPLIVAPGH